MDRSSLPKLKPLDKGSPATSGSNTPKGVPYLNGGLPAQSSMGDVTVGLDNPSGEDLPSWLPQILLRLAKLEQRVDAKERSEGGTARDSRGGAGGGGKTILSPLAPQASSSNLTGAGSNSESERRIVEQAKEEAKNLANDIVEAALGDMQSMLDRAYKAAEEATAASASAAVGQEATGPSSASQLRQIQEQLHQSAARISILDAQVQQLLAASPGGAPNGAPMTPTEQAAANAIASLSTPMPKTGDAGLIVAQTQAREASNKVEALAREVETLTKSVQRQQQSWSTTLGDVNNMRQQVAAVTAASNTCNQQLAAAQNHINSLVKLSEAMSNKQEAMGRDVSDLVKAAMLAKNTVGPAGVPTGDVQGRLTTLESDLNQLAGFAGQVTNRVSILEKDIVDTLSSYVRIVELKESENHLLSRHDQLHDEIEVIKLDIDAIAGSLEGTVVQIVARAPRHSSVYQRSQPPGMGGGGGHLPGIGRGGGGGGQYQQEPPGPPPKVSLSYQNSIRPRPAAEMGGKSMMRRAPN